MFFVLRHGQTDWNAALRLQGSTDIPLNETGRAQARKAAEVFKDQGITRIIASPLSRALETAQIVGAGLGIEPTTDIRLIERHFGLFEGLTVDDVKRHRHEMLSHMNTTPDLDGKHYPHNAETLGTVIDRVKASVDAHIASAEACLFVCHGIPFRAVTRIFLGEMHSSPNACPVRFDKIGDQWAMTALDPENPPIHASAFDGPTTMGKL